MSNNISKSVAILNKITRDELLEIARAANAQENCVVTTIKEEYQVLILDSKLKNTEPNFSSEELSRLTKNCAVFISQYCESDWGTSYDSIWLNGELLVEWVEKFDLDDEPDYKTTVSNLIIKRFKK